MLLQADTAVHADDLSSDIFGQVGGEEEAHAGHIQLGAGAVHRNITEPLVACIFGHGGSHGSLDESGGDGVATDVARAELLGERLGEADADAIAEFYNLTMS